MKVVFVEPETPGNIGALARAMNNFGVEELILINPQCEVECGETRARAKHAYDTVKNARILDNLEKVKEETDLLIGSTGITPDKYSYERSTLTPKQLKENIAEAKGEITIMLGREGKGLTNEELKKCDLTVHIPTNEDYPVMNITHAAVIMLYELKEIKEEGKPPVEEKETLERYFNQTIDDLEDIKKPEEVKNIFRTVINKSFIRRKEARSLIAAFRRIKERLSS